MGVHENLWELAEEAIEEYIQTIRWCLAVRKNDGGCLGYPAALLSLCIINAFGTYLCGEHVRIGRSPQRITRGEPFRVLNHPLFGQNLSNLEIKLIEQAYRNRLAHNAMLARDSWLLPGSNSAAFVFYERRVGIFAHELFRLVEHAWEHLDRSRIERFAKNTL